MKELCSISMTRLIPAGNRAKYASRRDFSWQLIGTLGAERVIRVCFNAISSLHRFLVGERTSGTRVKNTDILWKRHLKLRNRHGMLRQEQKERARGR